MLPRRFGNRILPEARRVKSPFNELLPAPFLGGAVLRRTGQPDRVYIAEIPDGIERFGAVDCC